jgi:hypothetical protein
LRFPDRNNFGPRVGFAYRFLGDTVLRGGYGIDYVKNSQAVFNDRNASFGLPFRIDRLLTNPNAATFNILQPFAGLSPKTQKVLESTRYMDPHFVMAYVQSWSLNIERRVPAGMVLQIGYMGNRMVHGKQTWNWNQSLTWPNRNDRFPGYASVTALTSGGDSRYHSLQVQLRKQFGQGLIGQAAYTWSKTLRNLVDEGSANSIWVHNPAMQWGRSPWDRAHVFTGNFVFELPFGIGKRWWHSMHPLLDAAIGGWQLSGILRIWSGTPLTITSSTARANLSVSGIVPADRLADGRGTPSRGQWFDITAFATPPYGRPGNAGYGIIDGPGLINEDLGLYKSFRMGEAAKMQLRLEAYNAFNHVNLSNPYTDVDNKSYLGKILTCGAALRMQVALRLDF